MPYKYKMNPFYNPIKKSKSTFARHLNPMRKSLKLKALNTDKTSAVLDPLLTIKTAKINIPNPKINYIHRQRKSIDCEFITIPQKKPSDIEKSLFKSQITPIQPNQTDKKLFKNKTLVRLVRFLSDSKDLN